MLMQLHREASSVVAVATHSCVHTAAMSSWHSSGSQVVCMYRTRRVKLSLVCSGPSVPISD